MKTITRITALAAFLCAVSCNTTVTEILDPVTGKPTARTTATTVDGAAVTAGANTLAIIAAARANKTGGHDVTVEK